MANCSYKVSINGNDQYECVETMKRRPSLFLRPQGPLVATTGRTFKRKLAISSCTLTASAGAPCKFRRTETGWKTLVETAVSPSPEETGLDWTSAVQESDGGWRSGDGLNECAGCVCQR